MEHAPQGLHADSEAQQLQLVMQMQNLSFTLGQILSTGTDLSPEQIREGLRAVKTHVDAILAASQGPGGPPGTALSAPAGSPQHPPNNADRASLVAVLRQLEHQAHELRGRKGAAPDSDIA